MNFAQVTPGLVFNFEAYNQSGLIEIVKVSAKTVVIVSQIDYTIEGIGVIKGSKLTKTLKKYQFIEQFEHCKPFSC